MPLGRSAGTTKSNATGQPASSRSSRWKWIAPYCSGAWRKSVSRPVVVVARDAARRHVRRDARVGAAADRSVTRSLAMSAEKSHAPQQVGAERREIVGRTRRRAEVPRPTAAARRPAAGRCCRRSGYPVPPSAARAAASHSGPPCGRRHHVEIGPCMALDGSSGQRRTGCCERPTPSGPIVTPTKYHSQRRIGAPAEPMGAVGRLACPPPADDQFEGARSRPGPPRGRRRGTGRRDSGGPARPRPGRVGPTNAANVKPPVGCLVVERDLRVRPGPEVVVLALPARRPCADGTTTCLKPGPSGFVSPWMSRTSCER